jgi:hypothetical protein
VSVRKIGKKELRKVKRYERDLQDTHNVLKTFNKEH